MSQPSAPKVLLIESHFDAAWQDLLPEDTSACRLLTACVPVPGSSGFSMHIFHNVFLAAFCCHMEKLLKTDVPQELLTQDEMLSNLCRVEECRVWRLKSAAIKQQFRRYKQTYFRRFSKSNFRLEKKGKYFAENDPQCFKVLLLHVFAFRGAFSTLQNVNFDVIQRMFGKSILHKLSSTSANWHFSLVKTMTNQDDSTMSSLLKEFRMVPLISSAHNSTIWNELALRTKAVNVQLIILKPSVY